MKIIAPAYYADFKCIASACRHSCCVGWEVDIDGDALTLYENMNGSIGERIRASINYSGEPHFSLCEGDRCPHLLSSGLCGIICECGEEALSQICRDHPRYRNLYDGVTEIGLGLSCEAVTALALEDKGGFLVADSEDMTNATFCLEYPAELFSSDEKWLADEKKRLFCLVDDESVGIDRKLEALLPSPLKIDEIRSLYTSLEVLDDEWKNLIQKLSDKNFYGSCNDYSMDATSMLRAFLFRHLSAESFYDPRTVGAFAALSVRVVLALSLEKGNVADVLRAYSAEIEYSTNNTETILDALEERIEL